MKKPWLFVLAFALTVALCACGSDDVSIITPGTSEPATTETTELPTVPSTDPTTCSHVWFIATCTAPKTCKDCGITEGAANGHRWEDATCTAPKICTQCGVTEGAAKGHDWQAATYIQPMHCAHCGETEGSPLEKPGTENYHGHVYTGGSSSKKYHYEPSCAGKNSHEITWEEVARRGLEPCGTCVLK